CAGGARHFQQWQPGRLIEQVVVDRYPVKPVRLYLGGQRSVEADRLVSLKRERELHRWFVAPPNTPLLSLRRPAALRQCLESADGLRAKNRHNHKRAA